MQSTIEEVYVIPGHILAFDVTIYDQEERVYKSENQAVARFEFDENDTSANYVSANTAAAQDGIFKFDFFRVHMTPLTTSQL